MRIGQLGVFFEFPRRAAKWSPAEARLQGQMAVHRPELRGEMDVTIFTPRTRRQAESCCITDADGRHWCFKSIKNIKLNGHAKCFVCCGERCNVKVYYTAKDSFHVDGKHVCAFDHEREYRKRMKYALAIDAMTQNPLARNRDVLATVKRQMSITLCE